MTHKRLYTNSIEAGRLRLTKLKEKNIEAKEI